MTKEEIICPSCEAEFYIESDNEVLFCAHCGTALDESTESDDFWEAFEEDSDEE
jgi:transcription initiation factor TFIIIB Brf1 subunit/transcription initiation factor TFIIB